MIEKKSVSNIELFLFVFTIVLTPQYVPVDIRPFVYMFWFLVGILRGGHTVKITKYVYWSLAFLLILALYTAFISLINQSQNVFFFLRYFRSSIALIVIWIYLSNVRITEKQIINISLMILLLHSLIILIEIIYPEFKSVMIPFSGESRIFYEYRANGLVNSYDFAGVYCNLGLLISACKYIQTQKKIYLLLSLIFVISVPFTSRLNLLLCSLVMLFILLYSISKKRKVFSFLLITIFTILLTLGLSLWSMTTDALPDLRFYIFKNFENANYVYETLRQTYPDNNLQNDISYQYNLIKDISLVYGSGMDPQLDPGFIQILYASGIISLIAILFYYFLSLKYIRFLFKKKLNSVIKQSSLLYITLTFLLLINVIGNFKLLFFFSTSIFELTTILLLIFEKKVMIDNEK